VTLTGSEAAGARVAPPRQDNQEGGARARRLGPVHRPADADIKTAATVACRARNQNNGQSCIAAKRFIV